MRGLMRMRKSVRGCSSVNLRAGRMRAAVAYLALPLLLVCCASVDPEDELRKFGLTRINNDLVLDRFSEGNTLSLVLGIENSSDHNYCIRNEVIKDPGTFEIVTFLLDKRGLRIPYTDLDFLPLPISGVSPIGPGDKIEVTLDLTARYPGEALERLQVSGGELIVAVPFTDCDKTLFYTKGRWRVGSIKVD